MSNREAAERGKSKIFLDLMKPFREIFPWGNMSHAKQTVEIAKWIRRNSELTRIIRKAECRARVH